MESLSARTVEAVRATLAETDAHGGLPEAERFCMNEGHALVEFGWRSENSSM
jgi:hypothetical protein